MTYYPSYQSRRLGGISENNTSPCPNEEVNYFYAFQFSENEFARYNNGGKDSVVYIRNVNSDEYNYVGFEEWGKGTEDVTKFDDLMGPNNNYTIDRFLLFRSIRIAPFTLYIVSGRSQGNPDSSNPNCFFLGGFVRKDGDSSTGKTLSFFEKIFPYSLTNTISGFQGNLIEGKTTLINATTPATLSAGNKIPIVFVYRTTNIPFCLAYFNIDTTNSEVDGDLFGGYENIYPEDANKPDSNFLTVSAWSDQKIVECINDNTKKMFYVYYDLTQSLLNLCTFFISIPEDRSTFAIETSPSSQPQFYQITIDPAISLVAGGVGSLAVSGNGKVIILNNRVLCLYANDDAFGRLNYFATEVAAGINPTNPIAFKNFAMYFPKSVPSNPFYEYSGPIVSFSGKYVMAVDMNLGSFCNDNKNINDFNTGDVNIKIFEFKPNATTTGEGSYVLIKTISDLNPYGYMFRYNIGFNEVTFDPSKDPFENEFTTKLWLGAVLIGSKVDSELYHAVYDFKISEVIPNYSKDDGLKGPFIQDPQRIKTILSSLEE